MVPPLRRRRPLGPRGALAQVPVHRRRRCGRCGRRAPRGPEPGRARLRLFALARLRMRGWPSLFLWAQGGALAWFHFGEGEYAATELAIAAELARIDSTFQAQEPLEPLRATDAPDAMVVPPSAEILPGGSVTEPWRSDDR